jgi:hypothetical protein
MKTDEKLQASERKKTFWHKLYIITFLVGLISFAFLDIFAINTANFAVFIFAVLQICIFVLFTVVHATEPGIIPPNSRHLLITNPHIFDIIEQYSDQEIVEYITSHPNAIHEQNFLDQHLLHRLAALGKANSLKAALDQGAPATVRDIFGLMPIHLAAIHNKDEAFWILWYHTSLSTCLLEKKKSRQFKAILKEGIDLLTIYSMVRALSYHK